MEFLKGLGILSDGLLVAILALGVFVSFRWTRFPDLTPDGSFLLGGVGYAISVRALPSVWLALAAAFAIGASAGCSSAILAHRLKVPPVVAGLLVTTASYSIAWMVLGKPNQYIERSQTIPGDVALARGLVTLVIVEVAILTAVMLALWRFSKSLLGLRLRAVSENPLLERDIGASRSRYTLIGLAIANGIVGIAGAIGVSRKYSADVNSGVGTTLHGIAAMMLGLALVSTRRTQGTLFLGISLGAIVYRAVLDLSLEIGVSAAAYRLFTAGLVAVLFLITRRGALNPFEGVRWQ